MKRVTRNGVIAVAAASGAMAVTMPAHADSAANGSAAGSPGLISGNTIQLPVHVPVNVCGNTVNVVGLLNPAAGNTCANKGGSGAGSDGAAPSGGATAHGGAKDSPGVLSGNGIQVPVDLPVNVSGNSVNVVGIGNPVFGNQAENTPGDHPVKPTPPPVTPPATPPATPPVKPPAAPPTPPRAEPPAPAVSHPAAPQADAVLAHTGTDLTAPAVAASAALLISGAALYRRFRPGAER
ncbi:chaplin [Streptomyces sp. NPDC006012]|uniref:chaplin n=1 Tax=Streptomyces sp. NPDC006012 TaxID=3364739 RepID=UPI00367E6F3F